MHKNKKYHTQDTNNHSQGWMFIYRSVNLNKCEKSCFKGFGSFLWPLLFNVTTFFSVGIHGNCLLALVGLLWDGSIDLRVSFKDYLLNITNNCLICLSRHIRTAEKIIGVHLPNIQDLSISSEEADRQHHRPFSPFLPSDVTDLCALEQSRHIKISPR